MEPAQEAGLGPMLHSACSTDLLKWHVVMGLIDTVDSGAQTANRTGVHTSCEIQLAQVALFNTFIIRLTTGFCSFQDKNMEMGSTVNAWETIVNALHGARVVVVLLSEKFQVQHAPQHTLKDMVNSSLYHRVPVLVIVQGIQHVSCCDKCPPEASLPPPDHLPANTKPAPRTQAFCHRFENHASTVSAWLITTAL